MSETSLPAEASAQAGNEERAYLLICKQRATQLQPKSGQPQRGGSYLAVCPSLRDETSSRSSGTGCVAPHSHSKRYAHSSRLAANPNLSLQMYNYFCVAQ
ncbi:MAG: hypothetical protein HY746_05265 [Elusimicrobia bacterium]|nr:hypothetical protein [Elusimicrobiota bacterium]